MKAYFTTSVRNLESVKDNVDEIFKTIDSLGHSIDKFNYSKNPDLDVENEEDITGAFKHVTNAIRNSDFMIAEMTHSSAAVGYEIAYALGEKKPVLVLVNETEQKQLSTPFRGNKSKLLKVKKYRNQNDIGSSIKYFIEDVRSLVDTKFILIIPPSIDKYLEWNAREKGTPKAEVTREAIERMMDTDEKYQDYLRNEGIKELEAVSE